MSKRSINAVRRTITIARKHADAISALVGEGRFSAFVDEAVGERLQHLRLDEWFAQREAEFGPIPADTRRKARLAWAAFLRSTAAR
jgi:hypothetical protein